MQRLEEGLGLPAHSCFEPQIVGALGAALYLAEKRAHKRRASSKPAPERL